MNDTRILVVEDEDIAREYVAGFLREKGYAVEEAASGAKAVRLLELAPFALVLSDIRMPDMDGITLLEHIRAVCPDTKVILATGHASVEDAVAAMQKGAYHYLAKPLRLEEVALMVGRALESRREQAELASLRRQVKNASTPRIIGHSRAVQEMKRQLAQIAPADCTVLILGETGTGKELAARALHAGSPRCAARFLAVNCATFTDELLANELFGHEKAAFTGAGGVRKGLLEAADKGTFFLDEVGDMSLSMQASLLRVLEDRTLFRVGGTREIPVDVRIIAATNRDLADMVEKGAFRRDLYYRLNTMTLFVPSLAEREGDIPLLARFFAEQSGEALGKTIRDIDKRTLELLEGHPFPGNLRELKNIMERAVILCNDGTITPAHLPAEVAQPPRKGASGVAENTFVSLEENERAYLARVLEAAGGSTGRAAALLGVNRGTLWRKLKRFRLVE